MPIVERMLNTYISKLKRNQFLTTQSLNDSLPLVSFIMYIFIAFIWIRCQISTIGNVSTLQKNVSICMKKYYQDKIIIEKYEINDKNKNDMDLICAIKHVLNKQANICILINHDSCLACVRVFLMFVFKSNENTQHCRILHAHAERERERGSRIGMNTDTGIGASSYTYIRIRIQLYSIFN